MKTQTLEYNKQTGKITLNTYTQDEFLETEIDITEQVTTLVLDKLYDEYGLEDGDELLITKNKSFPKIKNASKIKEKMNKVNSKELKNSLNNFLKAYNERSK